MTDQTNSKSPSPDGWKARPLPAYAIAVGVLIALVGGLVIGRATTSQLVPADISVEAGFARDMKVHHAQAVEMSMIVRDQTSDPGTRQLAYDIATSQQQQIGQMYGWLASWDLNQTSTRPSMSWMSMNGDHGGPHATPTSETDTDKSRPSRDGTMPGMATAAELSQLKKLRGRDAERLFLTMMVAHHQGGVEMANAALNLTDNRLVVPLASSMARSQSAEIEAMQNMLADRAA